MKAFFSTGIQFPFPGLTNSKFEVEVGDSISNVSCRSGVSSKASNMAVPGKTFTPDEMRRLRKYMEYDVPVYANVDNDYKEINVVEVHKAKKKVKKWMAASSEYLGNPGKEDPEQAGGNIGEDETSEFPLYQLLKDVGYRKKPNNGYQSYDVFEMRQLLTLKMLPREGGKVEVREIDNGLDLHKYYEGASRSSTDTDEEHVENR